jgi:nucleoside-diphosphate-sugar epimerase
MRIWVTGASGFIGSHVVRLLMQAGCSVVAQLSPRARPWRLQAILDDLVVVRSDLADRAGLRAALADIRPDACIHLAWYTEPGKFADAPANVDSLIYSLILLEELIRVNCRQVVMAGTCAEYDPDLGYYREDSLTRPQTLYAATKLSLGLVGQKMAASSGINLVWARPFFVYGPSEDERRLVSGLIKGLSGGQECPLSQGDQVRDYLHVEDVASALWMLTHNQASGIYNVSSNVPITIRQLAETVGNELGRPELIQFGKLPYREWEPMFMCGDNRKLRGIGWTPRFSLLEGVRHTIDWWKANHSSP